MDKQTFYDFSKSLLITGDIDPDYILIREKSKELGFNKKQVFNWILHKLVIYDSYSELEVITKQKKIEDVKYGNERRKSKNKAREYLNNIQKAFMDVDVERFFSMNGNKIFNKIKTINGFGSWSAWKFMDLIDCCYGIKVDFDSIDFRKAYTFPLKGLLLVNNLPEDLKILNDTKTYKRLLENAYSILKDLKNCDTPHNGGKGLRLNELETLLCKYHSHMHNKYQSGQDILHLKKRAKECII
jgi:hypothetical protein